MTAQRECRVAHLIKSRYLAVENPLKKAFKAILRASTAVESGRNQIVFRVDLDEHYSFPLGMSVIWPLGR